MAFSGAIASRGWLAPSLGASFANGSYMPIAGYAVPVVTGIPGLASRGFLVPFNAIVVRSFVRTLTVVPNEVGATEAAAVASLTSAGLRSNIDRQFNGSVGAGLVVSQSITPGTTLQLGTLITLVVSEGSQPAVGSQVYPLLVSLGFPVSRSYVWSNLKLRSPTGKYSRVANFQSPLVRFELTYEVLRDNISVSELKQLVGLFNSNQGRFGSFLFSDPDFNTVTAQPFATSTGLTTTVYQLIAQYQNTGGPGIAEKIQNLNGAPTLLDLTASTTIPSGNYFLGATGTIQFSVSPPSGHSLGWTGSFYYRCRFDEDEFQGVKFMNQLWMRDKLSFTSFNL